MTDRDFVESIVTKIVRSRGRARRVVLGGAALQRFDRAAPEMPEYSLSRVGAPVRMLCGVPVLYVPSLGPFVAEVERETVELFMTRDLEVREARTVVLPGIARVTTVRAAASVRKVVAS